MKLWDKGYKLNELIEKFTVGKDTEVDVLLAEVEVLGTLAHIHMLESIGLLKKNEHALLVKELLNIHKSLSKSDFLIEEGIEDIHSQMELLLTNKLGDIGKKVHSGRSRNDQVLVDVKLYFRKQIFEIANLVQILFKTLQSLSEKYKDYLLPGYTHLQVATPSSFGLWFGAYAESLVDDMIQLQAAYRIANQNPLGSAAVSGSSFPLNRTLTTKLLGFEDLNINSVYAHMSRGKTEKALAFALSSFGATMSKMAMDICLFMSQNFGFVSFPDDLTTGSSIMPHKKNPDVFELIRGKCNRLQALPNEISMVTTNLPSGYHRDFQLLKEIIFPAINDMKICLIIAEVMLNSIYVKENILDEDKYLYLFSVEEVNKEVLKGMAFRDAYKKIADDIEKGKFKPSKKILHTHEGSMGNLCNEKITEKMNNVFNSFHFEIAEEAIRKLLDKNIT
jgi:argininosuccinate lyase